MFLLSLFSLLKDIRVLNPFLFRQLPRQSLGILGGPIVVMCMLSVFSK